MGVRVRLRAYRFLILNTDKHRIGKFHSQHIGFGFTVLRLKRNIILHSRRSPAREAN